MPAEPAPSPQPRYPVQALTARQLRDFRRDLEHALKDLPGHAPVRALLRRQLADVQAEQDSRARTASPPGTGTGP